MATLSVVLITYNEEDNLRACLESVPFADEIVVVDDGSEDRTRAIAAEFTDQIHQRDLDRFGRQKQFAIEQASCDWILSLDADERVNDELAEAIRDVLERDPGHVDGYKVRRLTWLFGEPVDHSGWYKCSHLRLFRRGEAKYVDRRVHEYPVLRQPDRVECLPGHLEHYTYADDAEYREKLERYSRLAAEDWFDAGRRVNFFTAPWYLVVVPAAAWIREFVIQGGYRGGRTGLRVAAMSAAADYRTGRKLWQMSRKETAPRS